MYGFEVHRIVVYSRGICVRIKLVNGTNPRCQRGVIQCHLYTYITRRYMNIVADSCVSTDISLILDQQLHSLQQQADNLQKQVNAVLEQVGLKRQQVARAMKALVETKSAVKECMKLVTEISEDARIPLQRELLELLEIPIAPPLESPLPQPIATIHTVIGPEAKTPVISQVAEVPITAFLDHKDSDFELPTEELKDFDFDFDFHSEPQTIVVRKVDSKVDIRKGIMGPILISEDYPFLCRYQQHLHDKLGHIGHGYDTLLEEIGPRDNPRWQLLLSHLTDEQAEIMSNQKQVVAESLATTHVPQPETQAVTEKVALADKPMSNQKQLMPAGLTEKEKELIAFQKNQEYQKVRTLALAESIGIDTTPQLVELSNRMIYVSADPDSGALEHCYIGGSNEAGLRAWGKWLCLSPDIATHSEVGPSTRTMKFKFELKLWGMSLAKLKVFCAEGMLTQPPRAKTAASKALGSKLLTAK